MAVRNDNITALRLKSRDVLLIAFLFFVAPLNIRAYSCSGFRNNDVSE